MIEKLLKKLVSYGIKKYKAFVYSKFKPGHIFSITVDDMSFKMTFLDYRLGLAIIERIEGRREPQTVAIIKALVRNGSKVLELGGCYGYFTAIMSKCAGPEGKVVSIEGTPNNYKILNENMRINNISNVDAYNFFITSQSERVQFSPNDKHPYNAIKRLERPENDTTENQISVPARRLSSFLKENHFSPDYIFMDIEGFEVEVFEDFSEDGYLKFNRPVIVFEIHPPFYKGTKDLNFILDVLKQNNYYHRKIAGNLVCFPEKLRER
jgi:FkbM family methyltransferase